MTVIQVDPLIRVCPKMDTGRRVACARLIPIS